MILIASAAYVNSEFQVEFGKLPPSFLPIGNIRLFEKQIKSLQQYFPTEKIYISLPASFKIPLKDERYFKLNRVKVLRSDDRMRLSHAIACAISKVSHPDESLRLLHGDTFITDVPLEYDVIGVADTVNDYSWEIEKTNLHSESIWCGYFSFSDANLFKKIICSTKGSFVDAVRQYDSVVIMSRKKIIYWYDFGHINTYFQSRACITTERAFNNLTIKNGFVRKTGKPFKKIVAECNWFKKLPQSLRIFSPQLLDEGIDEHGQPFYSLEYLPLPSLNDIFVHGTNPVFFWNKIFKLCDDFMTQCYKHHLNKETVNSIELSAVNLAKQKTYQRLQEFLRQTNLVGWETPISINGLQLPILSAIVEDCLDRIGQLSVIPGISHGDFCLSNILFDSRIDRIKLVDPRGLDADGVSTIAGDLRFDLAKLSHSVIGLYDHIISGAFVVNFDIKFGSFAFNLDIPVDARIESIQKIFLEKNYMGKFKPLDVMPLTIILFFSMLPLHADNQQRQLGLFANALRLYAKYINKVKKL